MLNENQNLQYAYFGAGCFWCVEAVFKDLNGVQEVLSGYSGGVKERANYSAVCSGKTQHAEICRIKYDPNIISFQTLLKVFFLAHDPTTLNRQGNDIGPQYRSIIFYNNQKEKIETEKYIQQLYKDKIYNNITTELTIFKKFYQAENKHQNYFQSNPNQAYCIIIISPKMEKLRKKLKKYYTK